MTGIICPEAGTITDLQNFPRKIEEKHLHYHEHFQPKMTAFVDHPVKAFEECLIDFTLSNTRRFYF